MKENNKLIVEFLGWEKVGIYTYKSLYITEEQPDFDNRQMETINTFSILWDEMKFNSDWNWLMEVVEKIESIKDSYHGRFGVYISSNSCTIQSTNFRPDKPIPNPPHYYDNIVLNTKIESTYYSVLNFINFYNKQKEG